MSELDASNRNGRIGEGLEVFHRCAAPFDRSMVLLNDVFRYFARKAIPVPLNNAALAVLTKQIGKHPERVFTYLGKPIGRGSTSAWYRALKRVGLKGFRYHDLRHLWATWHVQAGTPLFALQEMAGWETERMVRRYAHLSGEHLAPHAEKMGRIWAEAMNDDKKPPSAVVG